MKYTVMEEHIRHGKEISSRVVSKNDDYKLSLERTISLAAALQYRKDFEESDEIAYVICEETPVGFNEEKVISYYADDDATYLYLGGNTFKMI